MSQIDLSPFVIQFLGPIEFQSQFIKDGHINSGWYIQSNHPEHPETVLQKINNHVFPDVHGLMSNIHNICIYLSKFTHQNKYLKIIPTLSTQIYYEHVDGSVWRMFETIQNSYTTQIPTNLSQVYEAGHVTGLFLKQLKDYPIDSLHIPIPDFHNTRKRYQDFLETVERTDESTLQQIQAEILFLRERSESFGIFWDALEDQSLPTRVTHNDTKLDNVLFDRDTHRGVCLIDLDTIMPGSALFDFGDALRAMGNPSSEDEPDLDKVEFQLPIFETYAQGYLDACRDILTEKEINWLALSPWLITIEIGMRFLTDFLQGNHYFRIHYPLQNLVRCRTQFKLAADMELKMSLMERIINDLI